MPPAPAAPPPPAPPKVEIPVTQPGSVSPQDSSSLESDFAELDSLDDRPKPAPKPTAKAPEPAQKPSAEKPVAAAKVEPPKAPEKPVEQEPKSIPEVRRAYEAKKKEIRDTWEPKVRALESELATLKASNNGNPDQYKTLTEKAAAAEKRAQELENEIRFVNYRKSKEFTDKYEKPYQEAWAGAISELEELTVKVRTGTDDLGEPTYGERKANPNDLMMLANLPLGEARKLAKEMFGDNADDIMAHRRKIRELSDAQNKALKDAETMAKEAEETRGQQSKAMLEQTGQLWQAANKTLAEKYPKWFAPTEGDEEGNNLLQKGFATVDRMFAPTPETQPKSPQEAVALHALIRNKAANHDRMALGLKKANARIAELETELKAYQESEPRNDGGVPGGSAGGPADWRAQDEAEIDALNTD